MLSDAQLETIVYAGEAHGEMLGGRYIVEENLDALRLARDDEAGAVEFRKGFFLGDGTGSGKGRQAAGILSTIGFTAAAVRSGSRNPTSFSRTPSATGRRLAKRNS